jgi:kynurenine formamidase
MTTRWTVGDEMEFTPVYCLEIPNERGSPIRASDLLSLVKKIPDAQGIFLRTGMFRLRDVEPEAYCTLHPWIHPEIPGILRGACPGIRLFGTDTISISSPFYREDGRECHRAFLCRDPPIILAEDLNLSHDALMHEPFMVTIFPVVSDDLDGVPVFAFAEPVSGGKNRNLLAGPGLQ